MSLSMSNQLHLFRRLEQCSTKQVNCETAVEFLKLCQNFDLTPTIARVDKTKSEKWNRSSTDFERNVIAEELRQKTKQIAELRKEISDVYQEIEEKCSPLRFICILKTIVTLRNEQYQQLMSGHTKKISRLLARRLLDETIENIAERAFENDWFNKEHNLNITKTDLIELLRVATKNQLFQFEGDLFEQTDGVAMGSPLGPLMANTFMCNIEKQLEARNKMPAFYKRYVDDTLSTMPNEETASEFLMTLNNSHPSINFTMELEENDRLPFLGMDIIRNGCHLDTKVYRKPTDTGLLLLHYHSHVDERYKRSLLNTMLNRAFKLSSTWKLFHQECERLKVTFSRLCYPEELVQSTICQFIESKVSEAALTQQQELEKQDQIRIVLPFKDQKSANSVRRQLGDLSRKINVDISPVYTSRKIKDEIKVRENKPPLVNQQCVVYNFQCNLCDAGYVGYTCRHLHQRIEEHKGSAIGNHLKEQHDMAPDDIAQFFNILKKCQNKFDCLIFEMFFIKELKPTLNKQCDSIRAKLFV